MGDEGKSCSSELSAAGGWLGKSRQVGGDGRRREILVLRAICCWAWLGKSRQVWAGGRKRCLGNKTRVFERIWLSDATQVQWRGEVPKWQKTYFQNKVLYNGNVGTSSFIFFHNIEDLDTSSSHNGQTQKPYFYGNGNSGDLISLYCSA